MSAKAEIGWERKLTDGSRLEVYAQHVGSDWKFYHRARRFDQWQAVARPPLEDWLELLDAVIRRIARRRAKPEEEQRLRKIIHERFPDAQV